MDDQVYKDISEGHQKAVIGAWNDMEDLERDAAQWPDAGDIEGRAADAVAALDALNDVINAYLERH